LQRFEELFSIVLWKDGLSILYRIFKIIFLLTLITTTASWTT
jgi:hypothetical protein